MDFNERVIPGISSNFMYREALARYEFGLKFLKPGMRVLDLGCGTGYGDKVLASKGLNVTGIDIDAEAISFARKNYKDENIEFKVGNILNLKDADKYFDAVISFEVIEHLKDPDKFLQNINQVLKPGGFFIMSTPNSEFTSPEGGVASPYHTKEFNQKELNKLLVNKFKKVEIFGQVKSKKALTAWEDFLNSQNARQSAVNTDVLGVRKLIPRSLKEALWRVFGNFFGRRTQDSLGTGDFPISVKSAKLAHYFIAVCQKSR